MPFLRKYKKEKHITNSKELITLDTIDTSHFRLFIPSLKLSTHNIPICMYIQILMTSHLNSEMASLITEDDHVFDVLEKLRSGRRPAASIISQAEKQYAKLRTELQLYKDEISQIKKAKVQNLHK
jgi:hypothetical protein